MLLAEQPGINPTLARVSARSDDVTRHLGDTRKGRNLLGFEVRIDLTEGLSRCTEWSKTQAAGESLLKIPAGKPGRKPPRPGQPMADVACLLL